MRAATKVYWLVVLSILKNMKVNGKDDIPYMKWKIKFMFETTNQFTMVAESVAAPLQKTIDIHRPSLSSSGAVWIEIPRGIERIPGDHLGFQQAVQ